MGDTGRWSFQLAAEFGHEDITPQLERLVADAKVRTGMVVVQVAGSTGALTTIEYEPGALADLRRTLDVVAPTDRPYAHDARWGDGNGFAHVRSALLKTSLAIPIVDARLVLGQWQQVVLLNLDNRARQREVVAVVIGSAVAHS